MTTDEALKEIQEHVQLCREEGETDLRGILYTIKKLRERIKVAESETIAEIKKALDASGTAIGDEHRTYSIIERVKHVIMQRDYFERQYGKLKSTPHE